MEFGSVRACLGLSLRLVQGLGFRLLGCATSIVSIYGLYMCALAALRSEELGIVFPYTFYVI